MMSTSSAAGNGPVYRKVMQQGQEQEPTSLNDSALVRELQCYERMWENATDPINKEVRWQAIVAATECLPAHPEGYEGPCFCAACLPDWADA